MATATIRQIGLNTLLKVAREERARGGAEIRLVVAGAGAPLRHVAAALRVGGGTVTVVEGGASSEVVGAPVPPAPSGTVRRAIARQLAGGGDERRARLDTPRPLGLRRQDLCLLVADGLSAAEQSAVINEVRDTGAHLVVSVPAGAAMQATSRNALLAGAMSSELAVYDAQLPLERTRLGSALAAAAGEHAPALGAMVPALRAAVVRHLVRAASRQNGVVGVVVFVPGADLPVMTANQVRMVLRIGRAYGFQIEPDRVPEIIGVVLAAVGFRTIAREALGFVPLAGWAVKGFFGYTGTLALGKAAVAFYERGALGESRTLADRVPRVVRQTVVNRIPDSLPGSLNKVLGRVGLSRDGS